MMLPFTPRPNTPRYSLHKKQGDGGERGREEGEMHICGAALIIGKYRREWGLEWMALRSSSKCLCPWWCCSFHLLLLCCFTAMWSRAKHAFLMFIKEKEVTVMSCLTKDARQAL